MAPSTIPGAGNGCFAAEFIPKGTLIWKLNPTLDQIYTEHNLLMMTDLEQEFVKTYAYMHNDLYFLCIDNARFFNHSIDDCNTHDPSDEYATYAARDINPGEEILSDYRNFGSTENDKKTNLEPFI